MMELLIVLFTGFCVPIPCLAPKVPQRVLMRYLSGYWAGKI